MSRINITIDGREIECEEGEYILNAARANDIFIPAICYLTRCSPTLACRICLVEANGKQVYACNAKTKDEMQITVTTDNIQSERRAIMEVYDVNHPLQCGVCDQSGECELQNYTLELGVDTQSYAIADVSREVKDWGHIHYDPALCIVCERCVKACKDMIGDNSLKTVPRGSGAIDPDFKESMPRDAYAMWNKLNKSVIGLSSGEEMLDCTSCGECAAVCPVGALVDTDFIYKTNAWEQQRIPATCSHCSAGCQINYEIKQTGVSDDTPMIYRVTNEWNYVSLCGAGRYGFDFENRDVAKDNSSFKAALEAFKKADAIKFTSTITNEEALILQKLKELHGYKLINEDARKFAEFLSQYQSVSGRTLYGGDLKVVHASNFVVSVGTALKSDNPNARYAFNNSIKMNKGAGLYFHPVSDPVIDEIGKSLLSINYAPLREEAVLYLLLDLFADKDALPKEVTEYLNSFHSQKSVTIKEVVKEKVVKTVLVKKINEESGEEEEIEEQKSEMVSKEVEKEIVVDENRLLELVNAPDSWDTFLEKGLKKKDKFSLIVGEDLYSHPNSKNLAKLVALIEKFTAFEVVMIPPLSNSLGVSLICDLDDSFDGFSVGYNVKADFTLSALGDGDLDMPALNQQEGTFTSINKQVNPTNAALPYGGYTLNDLANELGLEAKLTIDYTKALPTSQGFCSVEFDKLDDYYLNSGIEVRGYRLECIYSDPEASCETDELDENLKLGDGAVIYAANPVRQFSEFTKKSTQLNEKSGVYVSPSHELSQCESVVVDGVRLDLICDNKIAGDIACVTTFDPTIDPEEKLFSGYRFRAVKIEKES